MEQIEQTLRFYHLISICCFTGMIIFIVFALFMFFGWRIGPAIGILTGRRASRAIARPQRKENTEQEKKKPQNRKRENGYKTEITDPADNRVVKKAVTVNTDDNKTMILGDSDRTLQLEGPGTCLLAEISVNKSTDETKMCILDTIIEVHSRERIG